jgi:hypothetical protein
MEIRSALLMHKDRRHIFSIMHPAGDLATFSGCELRKRNGVTQMKDWTAFIS